MYQHHHQPDYNELEEERHETLGNPIQQKEVWNKLAMVLLIVWAINVTGVIDIG